MAHAPLCPLSSGPSRSPREPDHSAAPDHGRTGGPAALIRGPVGFVVAFVAVPAMVGAVLVVTAGPWPVVFAGCGYLLALVGLAVSAPADGPDDRDVVGTPLVPMERAAVREWVTLRWPLDAYDGLDHAAVRASEDLGFAVTTDELCDAAIVAVPRSGWRLRGPDTAERRKPLSIYA